MPLGPVNSSRHFLVPVRELKEGERGTAPELAGHRRGCDISALSG